MPQKINKHTRKGGDFTNDAYDASASFGRIMSYFQLFGGILFSIIFIGIGIYMIHQPALTGTAEGKITDTLCQGSSCTGTLQYTGLDKANHIVSIPGNYTKDQIVAIHYNPTNPSQVTTGNMSNKTAGIIFLIIGIFVLIGSFVWFYIIQKYKIAAAATGAVDAFNIGTNII